MVEPARIPIQVGQLLLALVLVVITPVAVAEVLKEQEQSV
jgi:hypothetical protein